MMRLWGTAAVCDVFFVKDSNRLTNFTSTLASGLPSGDIPSRSPCRHAMVGPQSLNDFITCRRRCRGACSAVISSCLIGLLLRGLHICCFMGPKALCILHLYHPSVFSGQKSGRLPGMPVTACVTSKFPYFFAFTVPSPPGKFAL
jgi:hypothetical protein